MTCAAWSTGSSAAARPSAAEPLDPDALKRIRAGLLEALTLKELPRAGWLRVGVQAPESVAAHSWGVAWLVLALCPEGLDRGRALGMAVLHDLPEVRAGDITPRDNVTAAEKRRREEDALEQLLAPVGERARRLRDLWLDFEEQRSAEARFVRACDRLDMALQAARYAGQGIDTAEFVESALAALDEPTLRALARG